MRQATAGKGGPAAAPSTLSPLDRELLELERRKMVTIAGGAIALTRAGYAELYRRGLVREIRRSRRRS